MVKTSTIEAQFTEILDQNIGKVVSGIPVAVAPKQKHFHAHGHGTHLNTPTILVVDDEPDVLNALRKRLEFMGFHVLCASDGPSGMSVAFRESPDAIILDIGLPMLDGHGVAERLRYNRRTRYTPVIFLTARTAMKDREAAEENCAFAYITKPFIAAEIISAVNRAVDLPKTQNDLM
jgi:DNA-binding response OmpR family regulator